MPLAVILGLAAAGVPAAPAFAFDAKKADQSVVRVVVFEIKNGRRSGQYSFGTGFVVDSEYVVTNMHVVDDSEFTRDGGGSERVIVDGSKQNLRAAQVVWTSAELDLAVLRVPGLRRPPLDLSGAPPFDYPVKGDQVWALGFPGLADRSIDSEQGFVTSTLTHGVVGKVVMGRASKQDKSRPVIQHNASINKGNSGGPLFDNCGVVVGVNTFGALSTMEVTRDAKGRDIAAGMPNTGIFFSPHIVNFIEAQKSVPALSAIKLRTSLATCAAAPAGEMPALPVWIYGVIGVVTLLALTSTVVAFRKGATREVVRVVESYSAYLRRKGAPPSIARRKAGRRSGEATAMAPAAAAGSWTLSGRRKDASFHVEFSAAELAEAGQRGDAGLVLGRSRSLCDKVVDDPSVSRRHAKFFLADSALMLEDMGSAFGTRVNGKSLAAYTAAPVKDGDALSFGGVTLALRAG